MSYDIMELSPEKRHWLLSGANIPRRFIGLEPADIVANTGKFPAAVDKWLDNALEGKIIKQIGGIGTTGVGLLFDGGPGLGKTTHAVTTLMEFIRRMPDDKSAACEILAMNEPNFGKSARPVYYMTYPEFLSKKKAMFDADEETKRQLMMEMEGFHGRAKDDQYNVRILVLDDLGKEFKGSGYNDASFDEILRARYDKALPTIITTNVDRDDWGRQYGDAMGSFAFEAFKRVRIIGEDIRQR